MEVPSTSGAALLASPNPLASVNIWQEKEVRKKTKERCAMEDRPEPADQQPRKSADVDTLRQWIADCDPYAPLDPATDKRYYDLGKAGLRGETDQIEGLLDCIVLKPSQSCQLFSGFSGSGKSTELRRLALLLEEEGFSVLQADIRDYHDLSHALSVEDLLVIIAGAFGEAVGKRLQEDAPDESYWLRFITFMQQDLEIKEAKISLGVADLKIGIRSDKAFWQKMRETLAVSPGKLREHSHAYIRECVARMKQREKSSRGVVFILDSLERLSAPLPDLPAVMESLVRVITDSAELLRLPDCHVVYTIPPYVRLLRPDLAEHYDRVSLILPVVKVLERGEALRPSPPGVAALCELVGRRIPLGQVFGARRDLLEKLVVHSGGHVRTLITFIKELLFHSHRSGLPVGEKDIERVVQPFREQAKMAIWRRSVPLLDRIRRSGKVEGIRESEYADLARYMETYVVLCYRNGDGWFEIHPLVRNYVGQLATEIAAEKALERSVRSEP
jgi:hypothetical protein